MPIGVHYLAEMYDCPAASLQDVARVTAALRCAAEAAGLTWLDEAVHAFEPTGAAGVTAIGLLSESHISVHTWPECGYAAFDIFMCGDAKPELGVEALRKTFAPKRHEVAEHRRGVIDDA